MEFTKEQIEQIVNMGAFGYPDEKIANVLGVDLEKIQSELNDPKSNLNIYLQKGKDMSDYVIDLKLFEMAKAGDIKALDKLDVRKRQRQNQR